jgi:hypothetical protein
MLGPPLTPSHGVMALPLATKAISEAGHAFYIPPYLVRLCEGMILSGIVRRNESGGKRTQTNTLAIAPV